MRFGFYGFWRFYCFIYSFFKFFFGSRRYIKHSRHCFIGSLNSSNFWKLLRCASCFQFSVWCLVILIKHCLSCVIYTMYYKYAWSKPQWKPRILWNSRLFIFPFFPLNRRCRSLSSTSRLWCKRSLFPFRKQAMLFLTVDAIIGNQAFQSGRCHICIVSSQNKVETG